MTEHEAHQYTWTRTTTLDRLAVVFGLFWFLTFGTVSAFVTHSFTFFPDSRQHHHYITVLLSGHLPHLTTKKINQEEHQPPLYYISAMPWLAIGNQVDVDTGVVLVRLWTLLLGSGVIIVTIMIARQLVPTAKYVPAMAGLLVAMNPQFYVMSAEINNDALASLFGSVLILFTVLLLLGARMSRKGQMWLGILFAAAFLTKMSLWPMVIGAGIVAMIQHPRRWTTFARLFIPLTLVAAWWLGRNLLLYGDPTVMNKLNEYFGAQQYQPFLSVHGVWTWTTLLFETYWARYRHFTAGMHYQTYAALKIGTVLAMFGLVAYMIRAFRSLSARTRWAFVALAAAVLIVAGGTFSYSLRFYQPQGRYLFPAQAAIAFFLALGLDALAPTRYKHYLTLCVVTGLVLLNIAAMRVVLFWG